jgi:hypothetical protein
MLRTTCGIYSAEVPLHFPTSLLSVLTKGQLEKYEDEYDKWVPSKLLAQIKWQPGLIT